MGFFSGLFLCELLLLVIRELRTSLFHLVMSRAVLGLTIANKCPFLHCGASLKNCWVGEQTLGGGGVYVRGEVMGPGCGVTNCGFAAEFSFGDYHASCKDI